MESWKRIPHFSRYEISNLGRLRNIKSGRILKHHVTRLGYHEARIYDDSGRKRCPSIHRMVCRAFNGEPPRENDTVNHRDGAKSNNSSENLEWKTHLDNIRHAWKAGLRDGTIGEESKVAILTEKKVHKIRKLRSSGSSYRKIASILGVGKTTVEMVCTGRTWSHVNEEGTL